VKEKDLQDRILLDFGAHEDIRLWRVNTGVAYGFSQVQEVTFAMNSMMTMVSHGAHKQAVERLPRIEKAIQVLQPTKYGIKGTADINGIVSYKRPDGSFFARFIGIEVKMKPRKATKEQLQWGKMIEERGGIWILAYSVDDVKNRLRKEGFDV